ncbi:MAG: hypothetical protein ACSLEZ_09460, partial [Thiobacillus sp.]
MLRRLINRLHVQRIARPHGRARIETATLFSTTTPPPSIARPHGRARIETASIIRTATRMAGIARPHGRA